jgi:methionine--tRNA ligase beta chain
MPPSKRDPMQLSDFAPIKPVVPAGLLEQLDFRVGTIESVADVPHSNKLVELRVNFGDHKRTILVGMKQERADPREVEGKQALFIVNLEPRTMAGRVSEGMLFDIGFADGISPVLAVPENPVPDGARAG